MINSRWDEISEEIENSIFQALNEYHQNTINLYRLRMRSDVVDAAPNWESDIEEINRRNQNEIAICSFLDSIDLPVIYDAIGFYGKYIEYTESCDFINEWVAFADKEKEYNENDS